MNPPSSFSRLAFAAVAAAAFGPSPARAAADSRATVMSPFRVEAEFGVDGLRIQNSQSVLNAHLLEQHGVGQLQDVSGVAPNLYSSHSDTRGFGDVLALRGITNSIFFSAPSVALYVDDVPAGSVSAYPSTLLDVESFIVRAGPQGTDYGRNAPGGVIDLKTRAPGGTHQGRVRLDYGSFNHSAVLASFDGPLGSRFGYTAAVGISDHDGYIQNTLLRRTADDRRAVAGRGALHWRPDANTQLRLGLLFEKIDDDATRLSSLLGPDPFKVASNLNGTTSIERLQLSFQAKRKFGWGTLVATTSRQQWDLDPSLTDLDLSPLPLGISQVVQSEELWTQEIRFESAPGPGRPQWRAGLFYADADNDGRAMRQFAVPPSAFVPPGYVQTERTHYGIGQQSLAGYANLDQPIAAKTTLRLGVRLEHASSDIDRTKVASNNLGFPLPQDPRLDRSQDHDDVSASAGIQHALSPALSVQARTALAHKPEGYSAFSASPALARFGGERQWAHEVGLTFGPPKSRFGGSVLAYWTTIDGYQFERTVPNSTDYVVVNANEVSARGLEAKFMWSPVERIWWDFQFGYARTVFEDHRDATGARIDGRRVPYVPRLTLRTGVTCDFGRGFSASASYAAVGRIDFDERNTALFSQKGYGLVNAQLRYRVGAWAVAIHGQNLFDQDYRQFINPEIFAASPGAPRRLGVQLAYEF
ncbi:MAG: TonB-dependent receptor [Verrucomicrobia bacterium]|nr:TonB-dependent receptor [Verrucomicrobiota bacterium]